MSLEKFVQNILKKEVKLVQIFKAQKNWNI